MAVSTTKKQKMATPKEIDVFIWQGVNPKGKKI